MTDTLTITGLVATTPRHLVTGEGLPITSFRLASTQRRYDRSAAKWIDGETNWYTITCFRQLAINVMGSIDKGQRIVVSGRLRVREWSANDRTGTNVEIDADALGHDLSWGTSVYTRSIASTVAHDADLPSDRAAVLEEGAGASDSESAADEAAESDDELAEAATRQQLEVALPF